MALFKSKKSPLDRMKVKDIENQVSELEKRKILLSAEIKKDQTMIARLKEDGQDKDDQERKSIAYRILRIDNGLKLKRKKLESIEKEILGLDNVRNLLVSRKESSSRNNIIVEADIEAIKQGAMEDKIRAEDYEKKLEQLSELTLGEEKTDDEFIKNYANSIWGTGTDDKQKSEEILNKKIDDIIKEKSVKEDDGVKDS